ncbi:hypothetical protein N0V95_009055 [Ascochyta clinopodiicola]|nr:hypothetical protein N0V95_009055 [Ascochyta clinopodiicola]
MARAWPYGKPKKLCDALPMEKAHTYAADYYNSSSYHPHVERGRITKLIESIDEQLREGEEKLREGEVLLAEVAKGEAERAKEKALRDARLVKAREGIAKSMATMREKLQAAKNKTPVAAQPNVDDRTSGISFQPSTERGQFPEEREEIEKRRRSQKSKIWNEPSKKRYMPGELSRLAELDALGGDVYQNGVHDIRAFDESVSGFVPLDDFVSSGKAHDAIMEVVKRLHDGREERLQAWLRSCRERDIRAEHEPQCLTCRIINVQNTACFHRNFPSGPNHACYICVVQQANHPCCKLYRDPDGKWYIGFIPLILTCRGSAKPEDREYWVGTKPKVPRARTCKLLNQAKDTADRMVAAITRRVSRRRSVGGSWW